MRKEKWEKPALIVLLRGREDQLVLTGCYGSSDPAGMGNSCNSSMAAARGPCQGCS